MEKQVRSYTNVAICPSAGIGHLTPSLRLASMLASSDACHVTLITILPTLSTAETTQIQAFLSSHPHITPSEFHALPPDPSTAADPFFQQYDAIARSASLLSDHLGALSPAPQAVFCDLMLASGLIPALSKRGIDSFVMITTSAKFFSLMVSRGRVRMVKGEDVSIPGLGAIAGDEIPPLMYNSEHVMNRLSDCKHVKGSKGVILNTFGYFEQETVSALQSGNVWSELPPVFAVGPLQSSPICLSQSVTYWLDGQPSKSVVFVSFGSRTAMSKDQIKEIAAGLEKSGARFLWVIKTAVVDKEDTEELADLLGETFFERTKEKGLIVKEWVNQEQILSHPSVGGFVTHCGWNSVMEAAQRGLPLLAWPLHGDQRINAGVVKASGLGIWERDWGCAGDRLVKGKEIADKIKELITSEDLKTSARRVGDEARKAWEDGGSSSQGFKTILGASV